MTSTVIPFQSRHYRPSKVANLHGCSVIRFPEKTRGADSFAPRLSYMDAWVELNCQAALALASIVGLQLRAVHVSLLHRPHDGASTCKKIYPETPKCSG